jgi:predicted MPP superfamily phosphohydrolase
MYRLAFLVALAVFGCRKSNNATTGGNSNLANRSNGSQSVQNGGSNAVSTDKKHSPGSIAVRSNVPKSTVKIVAFGDFGAKTQMMRKTMDTYHQKTPNPDMVFLLGDNTYSKFSRPTEYDIFFDFVARGSTAPHYPILGNYEYQLGVVPQMLDLSKIDSRWILPSTYHFQRFTEMGFSICVWFIDTEQFGRNQGMWLDQSITTEKPTCTWTIVNGHKPGAVQASGPKWTTAHLEKYLEPMLDKHMIDVYLCGHHHASQHLVSTVSKRHVFIVGQIMESHAGINLAFQPPELVWKTTAEPAYLELDISANKIDFAFHSGYTPAGSPPIHSGVINRV